VGGFLLPRQLPDIFVPKVFHMKQNGLFNGLDDPVFVSHVSCL